MWPHQRRDHIMTLGHGEVVILTWCLENGLDRKALIEAKTPWEAEIKRVMVQG
jgi:hypothetical protein